MKVVGLVSGGKDSCYNMMRCVDHGHEIVVLANLMPPSGVGEVDSFMYQSAGSDAISALAECMELPLIRREIKGKAIDQRLAYTPSDEDEVEDLYLLLQDVKTKFPEVEAVACGAIFSTYQRVRVENVSPGDFTAFSSYIIIVFSSSNKWAKRWQECSRLGLTSLAYLWRKAQRELLDAMINSGLDAVLVKVSSMGLDPSKHLGKSIQNLYPLFQRLNKEYQFHVCGEGGEYETLTLDCPLFKKRICLDEVEVLMHSDDMFAPVGLLSVQKCHVEPKEAWEPLKSKLIAKGKQSSRVDVEVAHQVARWSSHPNLSVHQYRDQLSVCGVSGLSTGSVEMEVRSVMNQISDQLNLHELSLEDVYFVHIYVSDMSLFLDVNRAYCSYFGEFPPSRVCIEVAMEGSRVVISCTAQKGTCESKFSDTSDREVLHVQSISEWAPTCIGPYSQANMLKKALVFTAGQIALDPGSMKIKDIGLQEQLTRSLHNNFQIFDAMDASPQTVVSSILYTTAQPTKNCLKGITTLDGFISNEHSVMEISSPSDDDDLTDEDEDHGRQAEQPLAQALSIPTLCVQVPALPRSAQVEIELVATTSNYFQKFKLLRSTFSSRDGRSPLTLKTALVYHAKHFAFANVVAFTDPNSQILESSIAAQCAYALIGIFQAVIEMSRCVVHHCMALKMFCPVAHFSQTGFQDVEHGIQKIFSATLGVHIPLTIIPVISVSEGAFFGAQLYFYDLDRIETDMWIEHML